MCEPGVRTSSIESRADHCPYDRATPTIGGRLFDADASPTSNLLDGHFYEHGGWATILAVNGHTCSKVKAAFGRADETGGSGQRRAFLRLVTSAGTTQKFTEVGRVGSLSADLPGASFNLQVSSDGGVPIFVKAQFTCTTENGF
jgi:hypothetical protein